MPQVTEQLVLTFNGSNDDGAQLACPQAHQLAVQNGDLSLDAGRKLIFPGDAPLSVSGDFVVLTGSATPTERLRVLANGNVGIGTSAPAHDLDVKGTLNATSIFLNGAPLSVTQWLNGAGGAIHYPAGNVGIGIVAPVARLHVVAPGGFDQVVPIVAQSNSTFFGARDAAGQQRFAINLDRDDAGLPVNFYDKYDGNWHRSLSLKLGRVGIGLPDSTPQDRLPRTPLHVFGRISSGLDSKSAGALTLFPPDTFAWFHIDNGPAGRNIGRLRISHGKNPGDHEVISVVQNGNVGINTANPAFPLDVAGRVHATGFPTSSDVRFKSAVAPLTGALARVTSLRPVSFEWNETYRSLGRSTERREIGLLAHEVEAVLPELVCRWQGSDFKAVDYGHLTAVLVQAIKELEEELDRQRSALEALRARPDRTSPESNATDEGWRRAVRGEAAIDGGQITLIDDGRVKGYDARWRRIAGGVTCVSTWKAD